MRLTGGLCWVEPFGKETVLLDGLRAVGEVENLSLLLCEVILPLSSGVTLVFLCWV
jgi:hypothetical protein